MERKAFDLQKKDGEPKDEGKEDGLYEPPAKEGRIRRRYSGPVLKRNLMTEIRLDPKKLLAATAVGVTAFVSLVGAWRK